MRDAKCFPADTPEKNVEGGGRGRGSVDQMNEVGRNKRKILGLERGFNQKVTEDSGNNMNQHCPKKKKRGPTTKTIKGKEKNRLSSHSIKEKSDPATGAGVPVRES